MSQAPAEVDPFDLPEWLGTGDVTWSAESGLRDGHHVRGSLVGRDSSSLPCDLLGVDKAYPQPVADDQTRQRAHLAWTHDQILLLSLEDRLTLVVPGTGFTADLVLDALARLAKAVGAAPADYAARLRIGG